MNLSHLISDAHTVVFDFDSTLVTIEGIDELARMKGLHAEVEHLTAQAMEGHLAFDAVFEKRLELITPNRSDIQMLGDLYLQHLTEGAQELVFDLKKRGKDIRVISGGYDDALYPVTDELGIPRTHVLANTLIFDTNGEYLAFDRKSHLWKANGKTQTIKELRKNKKKKWICIGDGITDYETSPVVDRFICFTGVVNRDQVVRASKYICAHFDDLRPQRGTWSQPVVQMSL